MNIEEKHLINKFLGYPYNVKAYPEQLSWSSSWSWLMPVVEKIESLGAVDIIIGRYECIITADDGISYFKETKSKGRTKIEMVYDSVVQFIKWYNER